jgi:hypothetical protein
MTLVFPSTNGVGREGSTGFRDVNFTTKQDFAVSLTKTGRRYLIERISLISKTITGVSTGATIAVCEGTLGVDTDARITLVSNATAPTDGATVTLGGKVYTLKDFVKGSVILTCDTNPSNNDTVTLGNKIYTFKSSLTASGVTANEVKIGASLTLTLDNLKAAVNNAGGAPATDYGSATVAHTQMSATTKDSTHLTFAALDAGTAGNALVSTETFTPPNNVFASATLSGGTDPTVEGQVKIGLRTNASICLANLKAAVNKAAGDGTLYFAAAAHTKVTATTIDATHLTFVANVGIHNGRAGNDLTGADDSGTLSWTNPANVSHASLLAFSGGLDGTVVNAMVAEAPLTTSDQAGLVQNLTIENTAEVLTGGNSLIFSIRNAAAGTVDIKDIDIEYRVI